MTWQDIDKEYVWHPYNALPSKTPILAVKRTDKTKIILEDGRELIDGMSSWWSAIHGYNHPRLNAALKEQVEIMPHIMFGGLTHEKAALLCKRLADLSGLHSVFLCDSGSVSVEVALKTAIQYQEALGKKRYKFIALEHAYHGDTLAAMSVCDPENSMHSIYGSYLPKHIFVKAPELGFDADCSASLKDLEEKVKAHHEACAGIIIEPVVQGAGGMRIYNPAYVKRVRELCDAYGLVMIADEIATGFGHTGKLFACEHAGVLPDILTLGKGLTGGYMSMAAMLTTKRISDTISNSSLGALMHGPTFMGNPLACSVALASIDVLMESPWQERIENIARIFHEELEDARALEAVADVRNIGAIGVIELKDATLAQKVQDYCVEHGVWIRPFGKLVYSIVAYIISDEELRRIVQTMIAALKHVTLNAKN